MLWPLIKVLLLLALSQVTTIAMFENGECVIGSFPNALAESMIWGTHHASTSNDVATAAATLYKMLPFSLAHLLLDDGPIPH